MKYRLLFIAVVFTAVLTACNKGETTGPAVQADCFQSATALAWLDENGNGVWDEAERPLPGIEFVLEPTVYSRTTSDENGVAEIFATSPGPCLETNLQVIAAKFDGYTLTTPQQLPYESPDVEYAFGFQPEAAITLVQTETYTGAIFPEAVTAENLKMFNTSADGAWTPSEADVAGLESGLTAFLQENSDAVNDTSRILSRLPDYERQYFGLVQGGDKLIQANFFCDGEDFDWQETAVLVDDGGDCYFQVIYNTGDETYLSLRINGES